MSSVRAQPGRFRPDSGDRIGTWCGSPRSLVVTGTTSAYAPPPRAAARARRQRCRRALVPLVAGYLDRTTNASTSIRGWPDVPSTLTTSLCELLAAAVPESSLTVAEPRVGPWVDIHATWKPVKVSVAVLPFTVAKSTEPPLAPLRVCRVQPVEYLTALVFSWNSDSLYTMPARAALVLPALSVAVTANW